MEDSFISVFRLYLTNTKDELEAIEQLVADGMNELSDVEKNGCSASYPCLTRSSQSVVFKVMISQLVEVVKTYRPPKQADSYEVSGLN